MDSLPKQKKMYVHAIEDWTRMETKTIKVNDPYPCLLGLLKELCASSFIEESECTESLEFPFAIG